MLATLYLIFNEGYAATSGDSLQRRELCGEAIRLARLTRRLMPDETEAAGLLALMLLQDSRREARTDGDGDLVLLDDQDRSLWDREEIAEGLALVEDALRAGPAGPYVLQAAIAAVHAEAATAADTDWRQIAGLYLELYRRLPTPVVALNRAVAVAMAYGPEQGLELVDDLAGERHARRLPSAARHPGRPAAPPGARRPGAGGVPEELWRSRPTRSSARSSSGGSMRASDVTGEC